MANIKAAIKGVREAVQAFQAEGRRWQDATKKGVEIETRATQLHARSVVMAAFSGGARGATGARKVANAVRMKVYDNAPKGAAGTVYSKFGAGRGRQFADFIAPRLYGGGARARKGRYMLIPAPRAGQSSKGVRNRGMQLLRANKLALIRTRTGQLLLVHKTRTRSVIYFFLEREVRYPPRTTASALLAPSRGRIDATVLSQLRPRS